MIVVPVQVVLARNLERPGQPLRLERHARRVLGQRRRDVIVHGVGVKGCHAPRARGGDGSRPALIFLHLSNHPGHVGSVPHGHVMHAGEELVLEEFLIRRARLDVDDDGAAQEQRLELVRVPVGSHVDQVPVPAHLLEAQRALVLLQAALVRQPELHAAAFARRGLFEHLVDKDGIRVGPRHLRQPLPRLRLGVPRERRQGNLIRERNLRTRLHQPPVRHGPPRRGQPVRAIHAGGRERKIGKRNVPRGGDVRRRRKQRRGLLPVGHALATVEPLRVRSVVGQQHDGVIALVEHGVDVRQVAAASHRLEQGDLPAGRVVSRKLQSPDVLDEQPAADDLRSKRVDADARDELGGVHVRLGDLVVGEHGSVHERAPVEDLRRRFVVVVVVVVVV